jgi:hypothetical protein
MLLRTWQTPTSSTNRAFGLDLLLRLLFLGKNCTLPRDPDQYGYQSYNH